MGRGPAHDPFPGGSPGGPDRVLRGGGGGRGFPWPGGSSLITLPMISPTILLNVVIIMINQFQVLAPLCLSSPRAGPGKATYLYSFVEYNNAFHFLKMGYAWGLFRGSCSSSCWCVTLLLFRSSRRWVYSESGKGGNPVSSLTAAARTRRIPGNELRRGHQRNRGARAQHAPRRAHGRRVRGYFSSRSTGCSSSRSTGPSPYSTVSAGYLSRATQPG